MKELNKEELIELFNSTKQSNLEKSLDEILYEAFNKVKDDETDSFENFRKAILSANGINEYDYYTKSVDPRIKRYVEGIIFPQYSRNDQGHGIIHIKEVIRRSFALNDTLKLGLDHNLMYTIAACHDWGKFEEPETGEKHAKIAGRRFINDEVFKDIFNEEEFEIIWTEYPNKKGKANALKSYIKARKKGTTKEEVMIGLNNYLTYIKVEKINQQYIKHGSTWFNQECWNDDYTIRREVTTKDIAEHMDFSEFR